MHLAPVTRVLAAFTAFFSCAQMLPLGYALYEGHDYAPEVIPVAGFGASIALGCCVALLLWLAGRGGTGQFFRREGIAVVGSAWILASVLGAVPYVWSGAIADPVDAVFETVSGLTTTGASVLGTGLNFRIEDLPRSILLWRSLTHWIGGLGIVLLFVTLVPALGITGKSLIESESITVGSPGVQPRILAQARLLFLVYALLTAACALLLWASGIGPFDAVNHAFSTLATGGFSTRNLSVGAFHNLGAEIVLTVFMFLAGCNFGLLAACVQRGPRALLGDPEFRVYCLLLAGTIGVIALLLWCDGRTLPAALRAATFNTVSVTTCTGFATEDFQAWPLPSVMLLLGSMVVGACTGSTAGGVKVIRLVVVCKLIAYTVRHHMRPRSVERIKVGGEALRAEAISAILALVLLWIGSLFAGAILIALDARLPFLTSLSAAATSLSCCGPSLCDVDSIGRSLGPDLGPLGGYGELHGATKLFLAFLMLLGRLEFLGLLALLTPSFWRR